MNIQYRKTTVADFAGIALLRADENTGAAYWENRIAAYVNLQHHPQHALNQRVIYAAMHQMQ